MNPLVDSMRANGLDNLGTLVVVGAGDGDLLDDLAGVSFQALHLIEGDGDAFKVLLARCAGRQEVHCLHLVAAPDDGPVAWHCFSLRDLNGPLDSSALKSFYPRLRLLSRQEVQATALAKVLQRLELQVDPARPHVLVFDVPGQEHALLRSLPAELLHRFDRVLVRGCSHQPTPEWAREQEVADVLEPHCFALQPPSGHLQDDPLWPVRVWRHDAQAARLAEVELALQQTRQELQQTRQELEQHKASEQSLLAQWQAASESGLQLRARLDAAARRLAQAESAATEQAVRHARDLQDWAQRLAGAEAAGADWQQRCAEQADARKALQAEVARLKIEEASQAARIEDLQNLRDLQVQRLQESLEAERHDRQQERAALQQQLAELEGTRSSLQSAFDKTAEGAVATEKQLSEARQALQSLELQAAQWRQEWSAEGEALRASLQAADNERDAAQAELQQARRQLASEQSGWREREADLVNALAERQAHLEQRDKDLAAALEARQQLGAALEDRNAQWADLGTRLREAEQRRESQQSQVAALQEEARVAAAAMQDQQELLAQTQQRAAALEQERSRLQDQLEGVLRQRETLEQEAQARLVQLQQCQEEAAIARQAQEETQLLLETQRKSCDELASRLQDAQRSEGELGSRMATLQSSLASAEQALSAAAAAREAWQLERHALQAEQSSCRTQLEQTQQALQQKTDDLKTLRADRDQQAHWHQENAAWAKALDAERTQLKQQLATLQEQLNQSEQQSSDNQARARQAAEALQTKLELCEADMASARGELEKLGATLAEQQQANTALSHRVEEADRLHSELQAKADGLQRELALALEAVGEREEEAARGRALGEGLKVELAALQGQIEQIRQELQGKIEELKTVRADRDQQARWHQENANWAKALDAERTQLKQQLATLQDQLNRSEQQSSDSQALAQQAAAALQAKLDLCEAEIATVRGELEKLGAALAEQQLATAAASDSAEHAERLRGELQAEADGLQQKLAHALEALSERDEESARVRAVSEQLKGEVAALQTQIAQVRLELQGRTEELKTVRADRDQQAHWHQENAKWARSLDAEKAALKQQLEAQAKAFADDLRAASKAQAMATKLQLLREADLKDLQRRYQDVQTQHSAQRDLLGKLAQRLTLAHQYFQQLQLESTQPRDVVLKPSDGRSERLPAVDVDTETRPTRKKPVRRAPR